MADTLTDTDGARVRPWVALWAVCLGFFMILVDVTIVAVAIPAIQDGLHTDVNSVIWVSSAYLLTYAVPLLVTGRLGDRFGPRRLYLAGLVVFTLASLWCGFTDSIGALVTARAVQGVGAALMTPQTMTVITRVFPARTRGKALGTWSAVAGVATLSGPILGGVLVVNFGWQWIFYVNVPIGIAGFALAWRFIPSLPTRSHRFDIPGVVLSGIGMFLLVFGIQEGQTYDWDAGVWTMVAAGVVVLAGFVYWQRRTRGEPLVPLSLFRDRNFSLANISITTVGFTVTALNFPLMLYAQNVLGLSALRAALLMVPVAVLSGALAPYVGRLSDRVHPRYLAGFGMLGFAASLAWLAVVIQPHQAIWKLVLPLALMGVAQGFIWSPMTTTATRNFPMAQAGAGSGVYNTTRQVGSVLGSAAIAVLMQAELTRHLGGAGGHSIGRGSGVVPAPLHDGFATAMGHSLLLPAVVIFLGFITVLLFERPSQMKRTAGQVDTDGQARTGSGLARDAVPGVGTERG